MKRSRDEMNSPHRGATVPSRPEPSSTQPQTTVGSSSQKLTTSDALQYLKDVKEKFRNATHKYDEFLEIMKDFKAQRIQTGDVIARVKDLFQGNRHLTLGFNTFLPKGYQITLPEEVPQQPSKKPVEFEEAISFVNKIKTRFQGDDRVYKAFLGILNMYRKDNKAIADVYQEVSALFSEHPDLLSEFRHFLPDSSSTAPPTSNKNSLLRHGEKKLMSSQADRERSVDRPDVDIDRARAEKRRADRDMERRNERDNREREYEDRDFDHNGQHISQKRKSVGQQFVEGENSSYGIYSREFAFCEKVKEIFSNSDGYENFINFLNIYNREKISRSDYEYQVNNLFGKHHELVEEFIDLFPHSMNTDGFLAALRKRLSRSLKIEDRDRHSDRERTLKDRERGSERGVAFGTSNGSTHRMPLSSNKDKYALKPIQELDLSNCDQCTPSYRLLPKDYPIPKASQKTEMGADVLNDHWVSVTSGSEDYSFKHMRKNQYEESLFRCEDDRFELDMLIELTSSAAKRVEELLNKITDNSVEFDSTFCITDHLTVLNIRCIERIYAEHGLDVVDILKKNAPKALPVILSRLKQKQEDWANSRAGFNKIWADVYANNHHKSLDHRSFYFKQQDAKNISAKALVEEIKELREKMINENDEILLAMMVGNKPPVIPEMEFTYPDPEIHDDLYKLVEYSCGEICSGEELKEVLDIWVSFVEPMLGAPRRVLATDNGQEMVDRENGVEDGPKDDDFSNENLENAGNVSGVDANSARQNNAGGLVGLEMRLNAEHLLSFEGGEGRTPVASTNVTTTVATEAKKHTNGSVGRLRVEREEGELSPNGDFEKDNFATYGNADVATAQVPNGEVGENEANNEGQGSDPRSTEGSENASENGDVTGGESDNDENNGHDHDENENKAESEGEDEVEGEANDDIYGLSLPSSQSHFQTAKPIRKHFIRALQQVREKKLRIFYGNDSIYVLLRLHQVLYERIQTVKVKVSERDLYSRFLSVLYDLLDGSCDNAKFEDECRAIIGTQSYILFTLDKLIFKIVKQLQAIATDESAKKMFLLYAYENSRRSDTFDDATYHENACVVLQEENLYRIECFLSPTRMSIQLVGNTQKSEGAFLDPKFVDYMYEDFLSSTPKDKLPSDIFLKRNKRKYPGNEDEQYLAALDEVHIVNGLESRISPASHKVRYVLGTEDILYRPRNKNKNMHQNGFSHDQAKSSKKGLTRSEKFNLWLSGP